jgi:hypothetical protein
MRAIRAIALFALLGSSLAACVTPPPPKDYAAFKAASPRSILVVPVVNKSTQVDAPDNFLATLPVPLAEHGYYVFPVNMVKRTMEDDGIGDADLVAGSDPVRLASLFGADAVLYASIEHWEAHYIVLSASTEVEVHYTLKSGKTGATLWDKTVHMSYTPQAANTGNIIGNIVAAAIVAGLERAHPNYIPLANQANGIAFYTKGQGVPAGPYDPAYGKDD